MITTITKLIADLYQHGLMCMFVQSKKEVGVCTLVSVCRKSKRVGEERGPSPFPAVELKFIK